MSKSIHRSKSFELVQLNSQLFIQFNELKDKPRFYFESLENYMYESQGIEYIEKLARDVLKKPAEYDQRLRYSKNQSISPPREAFYLDESYYTENHNRKAKTFLDNVKYLIGMYSDGASLAGMSKYLEDVLKEATFENINLSNREHYYLFSSFICLISLLDIETKLENKQLENLVSEDRLLDLFYYQRKELNIDIPILYQDPYLFISLELTREEDSIKQYCINFYHSMKSVSWYESHRQDFSEFFGYWSFELAFLVRFMHVNDIHFLDHMYYPRDLALRKFLPTWKDNKEGEIARDYKQQFLDQKQEITTKLIKEVLDFVENELEVTISTILSSDLFKKAMFKISESVSYFESLEKDPSEKEFVKIRSLIADLVDLLSDSSGKLDSNSHLKQIENEIKARVIKQFDSKEYTQQSIDEVLGQYFDSNSFEQMAEKDRQKMHSFSQELKTVQQIKDAGEYWDTLDKVFQEYGIFDENKPVHQSSKKMGKKKENKSDVSFRISFNDYL